MSGSGVPERGWTMGYTCLQRDHYQYGDYTLTSLREQDILLIKEWRNDQIDILRQKEPLTDAQQINYYETVVRPAMDAEEPSDILFSYLHQGECVGYGGLTHIDWTNRRAEISFLLATERNVDLDLYKREFTIFLKLIKQIAFVELGLNRLFTETYDVRPYVLEVLENSGFVPEGRLREHVVINGKCIDSVLHGCLKEKPQSERCFNVLVTSIANKVPLIKALRKASLRLGNRGKVIGADARNDIVGKYFVDDFWLMPKLDELEIEDLIAYCRNEGITCIIPTRDGELSFFAENADVFARKGISVMISDPDCVRTCLDKLLFAKRVRALGFPAVEAVDDINNLSSDSFVVKERFGAGAHKIGLGLGREQALAHAGKLENPVFQPYIAGKEASVDVYVDRTGKVKGAIARTRDLVVHGESQITTTFENKNLEQLCAGLAEKLGINGHAIFQVIIDEDEDFHIIECNSRFGGASTLSLAAGLDSFYWFLLESQGVDISDYPFIRLAGKKQVRYLEDILI